MNITPYILIGGRSARFGRDKASFEYQGETMAARAARICENALPGIEVRFVSKTNETTLGRWTIADVYPDRGAAGAIHAALADASTSWIFVVACDLPLVTAEFILKLSEHIDETSGCVVPVQPDGRWQPLCAFYRADICLPVFKAAILGDGPYPSLRSIVEKVEPRIVEFAEYSHLVDAHRLLTNVNTIPDLEGI